MFLVAWALAALVCGAVVWKGPVVLRPARDLLMPMWLPLTVMVIAGIFLFAADQGRDLGVGLLGNGQFKMFLLFLALIYWATGSWHTARLGLNRRFGTQKENWPEGYEPWLRWLPRLLGVCAHLFASLSLAFAARHAIEPDAGTIGILPVWLLAFGILPVWLVAFVPPAAILLGTWILWLYDRPYAAAKRRYEHAKSHYKAAGADDSSRAQAAYAAARSASTLP
jgi:hypothetical protein